jgi:hypothetical protein
MTGEPAAAEAVAFAIGEFCAGRLAYDRLLADIAAAKAAPAAVARIVADFVNTGRLPDDIGRLIEANAAAGEAAAAAPEPLEALRSRVEEVVTAALVADFRRFRDRPARTTRIAERQLDSLLSTYHGLRLRHDAHAAVAAGHGRVAEDLGRLDGVAEAGAVPALAPGAMLNARFVLDAELGRGGMGRVFRAVDRRRLEALDPQPFVAVKLLAGDFRRHPDAFRAFEAEARKAQILAHPNICTVFDFDRDGPHGFIVMELLEGATLRQAIGGRDGAPLAAATVRRVIGDVLAGLAYAHSRAVVHADVKPENLFLTREGPTKILDFGVATAMGGSGFDPTALRAVSPGYSSPELASGSAPRDPRDDVFSAAAVAYLLVAGRHPFDGMPAEQAEALALEPAAIGSADPVLSEVLRLALSFRREDRPADAAVLAELLVPALSRPLPGEAAAG